ncbi:MAG: hypothetical protein PVI30_01180 [Myxococcales bacterium]
MPLLPRFRIALTAFSILFLGCGGAALSAARADQMRRELREAMTEPVPDRHTRDRHSRFLADVVDRGALAGMNRADVRAAFGPGQACRSQICRRAGFGPSDWYYEVGRATGDGVKQLPVLIVGFDHRDRAVRVWNLTTH